MAQNYKLSSLAENRVDNGGKDTIVSTYPHALAAGKVRDPLSVSYRIARTNSDYTLEIRLMNAGEKLVVAKNELMEIWQADGERLILRNSEYAAGCRGCGARGVAGSDAEGITLFYPLSHADVVQLRRSYPGKIRVHEAEGYWFKNITARNGEIFEAQMNMVVAAKDIPFE